MANLIAPVNTPAYGAGMKETLTAQAWIEAAFRALTIGGPQAIRAEAIARDLKVSKGSFYWHFKNVAALKSAMLSHWHDAATRDVVADLIAGGGTAADKLKQLIDITTSDRHDPYGGVLAEAAIRDWARYNAGAAAVVKKVNKTRIGYLKQLFHEHGVSDADAPVFANIIYGGLIGMEYLAHQGLSDYRQDLQVLLDTLLNTA